VALDVDADVTETGAVEQRGQRGGVVERAHHGAS
jgi:hypothetical protein